jgi:hypothetical protein
VVARIKVVGTEQFERLARDLKAAGDGKLRREMTKAMKTAAKPVENDAKNNVLGVSSTGTRGGAGARAARAAHSLRRRKKLTERAKLVAHRRSGLRASVARTVQTQVRAGGNSASVRIRSNSKLMPADQQKLPQYMNTGRWRHPVFGNQNNWVGQVVAPREWFDRAMRQGGPKVRDEAIDTVEKFIQKLG